MAGVDDASTLHFAQVLYALAESHQPGLVASLYLLAVVSPRCLRVHLATVGMSAQACSPAVVAGDDKGGIAAIELISLAVLPQLSDVVVVPVGCIEILLPLSMMRIVVGLAELHKEQFGVLVAQGLQGAVQGYAVSPHLRTHPVFRAEVNGQFTSAYVQDVRHYVPACHGTHPVPEIGRCVNHFQHRPVGVILFSVVEDVLIVGHTA